MTTQPEKLARKRKPPTQLIVSEDSKQRMQQHLQSEEGNRSMDEFAKLIADWAVKQMPPDLLQGLSTREGQKIMAALWPDIVNAYFKMLSNPPRRK